MAGSHSSTAATALPEASEMHQASGNRSNGYHGTENCSSTPPTKGEQQTVSIHEIQSQTFEKAEWERVKAAVDTSGWTQLCKTPEQDTEHPDQLCECYSTSSCSAGKSGWTLSALLLPGRMKRLLCQAAPLSLTKRGTLLSTVHKH